MPEQNPGVLEKYCAVLERSPLMAGLTTDELKACLPYMRTEGFSAGEEILTEGNKYHGVWIILDGLCEVIKHGQNRSSRLATLEPSNIFGEMSFLHSEPHSASVRAVDHVETIRLMFESYEQLRVECPSAAHKIVVNIVRVISDRLRRMDEWTCELVERSNDRNGYHEWQEFRAKLYSNLFD